MIVKYFTALQRLAFGDKDEDHTGFYWQSEVDDPWIGPFETLEEASTDAKQSCFDGDAHLPRSDLPSSLTASPLSAAPSPSAQLRLLIWKTVEHSLFSSFSEYFGVREPIPSGGGDA